MAPNNRSSNMLLSIMKRQAKALKNHTDLTHAQSQALLARTYRCADFHELKQIMASSPDDARLHNATFSPSSFPGTADGWRPTLGHQAEVLAKELDLSMLEAGNTVAQIHGFVNMKSVHYQTLDDLISSDKVFYQIDNTLEDELSGSIAETNAYAYAIDDYEVVSSEAYDDHLQKVILDINYTGEQHPDKPWSGNQFRPRVDVYFKREEGEWVYDSLEINSNIEHDDMDEWHHEDLMQRS